MRFSAGFVRCVRSFRLKLLALPLRFLSEVLRLSFEVTIFLICPRSQPGGMDPN